jgi:uncharacterized protein
VTLRVVIDANVWISAARNPSSIPGQIVQAARDLQIQSVISTELVNQVQRHLIRLGVSPVTVSEQQMVMQEMSDFVHPSQTLLVIEGKDSDNRVLECAIERNADYIVTGDKKHVLPLGTFQGI